MQNKFDIYFHSDLLKIRAISIKILEKREFLLNNVIN